LSASATGRNIEFQVAGEHRVVTGRRADLTRVQGKPALRRLRVEGSGVRSIEGIEAMPKLDTVSLERLAAPDLRRLAALPALRKVVLLELRDEVDWPALESLTQITSLFIATSDPLQAAAIASVDYGALSGLEVLRLNHDGGRVPTSIDWLGRLPRLALLSLNGFVFDDSDIGALASAVQLEDVVVTPASAQQWERLQAAMPPGPALGRFEGETAALGVIRRYELGDEAEYSLGLDLAGSWGVGANIEAEAELARLLEMNAPEVARRVRFDTESSAVWVVAPDAETLETVQRLAAARPPAKR
jgi:hypothetical protein